LYIWTGLVKVECSEVSVAGRKKYTQKFLNVWASHLQTTTGLNNIIRQEVQEYEKETKGLKTVLKGRRERLKHSKRSPSKSVSVQNYFSLASAYALKNLHVFLDHLDFLLPPEFNPYTGQGREILGLDFMGTNLIKSLGYL